jgi:hypothetical protein
LIVGLNPQQQTLLKGLANQYNPSLARPASAKAKADEDALFTLHFDRNALANHIGLLLVSVKIRSFPACKIAL